TETAKAMGSKPAMPPAASAAIVANLHRIGWTYVPTRFGGDDVSGTHTAGDPSGEPLVNSYLYVSLLFSRYAAQLSGETHVGTQILSPSQASAFVAAAAADMVGRPKPLEEGTLFGPFENILTTSRPGYERSWQS